MFPKIANIVLKSVTMLQLLHICETNTVQYLFPNC